MPTKPPPKLYLVMGLDHRRYLHTSLSEAKRTVAAFRQPVPIFVYVPAPAKRGKPK